MAHPSATKLKGLVFATSLRAAGADADLASMRDFDLPLYDGDVEKAAGIPAGAQELERRLLASDAFIIASPEYNASMAGRART